MTLTVRSASLTGATTAARALTHAEMDANWAHVIESSNQNFTPSGNGAVTRSVAQKLGTIRHLSDYDTLQDAITASYGRKLILDVQGNVDVEGGVTISSPIQIVQEPGCILRPDMAADDSIWCRVNSSDVEWIRPVVDGSQLPSVSSVNKYIFLVESSVSSQLSRIHLFKPKIYDCEASDGNEGTSNLLVTHGIYANNIEDLEIDLELIRDISGAAVFWKDIQRGKLRHGLVDDTGWYSIHLDQGCTNFDIAYTKITSTGKTKGRFYGGSVNLMSLQTGDKNERGRLFRVVAEGKHNYGSAFRLLSTDHLDVIECEANDCESGDNTDVPAGPLAYFNIDTRGVDASTKQAVGKNVKLERCKGVAAGANQKFIVCQNQYHTDSPFLGLHLIENECKSPDESTDFFGNAIIVHGQSGGFRNVRVLGNTLEVKTDGDSDFVGAINFLATDANGQVANIQEGSNDITNIRTSGWTDEDTAVTVGTFSGPFVRTAPTFIDNFYYGTRVSANVTDARNINHQVVSNVASGGAEVLVSGTMPTRIDQTNRQDTTANRPASGVRINYEMRYNTTTKRWEYFAGDDAGWVSMLAVQDSLDAESATNLGDVDHAINTKNKYRNKCVRNTTDGKRYFANGAAAADIWILADASASISPS
jgi:hypothetical protein